MKQVLVILFLSLIGMSSFAETATLCGTYRVESSNGLLTVMRDLLDVSSGPTTPAFETYELAAAGETFSEVEAASNVINSLVVGQSYCIKGEIYQKPNFEMVLIPEEIVPYSGQ